MKPGLDEKLSFLPWRIRSRIVGIHRKLIFRKMMKKFIDDPESCLRNDSDEIDLLIYGWGNEAWSALSAYLIECVKQAMQAEEAILECGSGLSTVLIAVVSQQKGIHHWALEHNPEWSKKVQTVLDEYGLRSTTICHAPLKSYGEYSWYAPPLTEMPQRFGLLICDGPPGDTPGGRSGVLPVMKDRIKEDCTILIDDAEREAERVLGETMASELGGQTHMIGGDKPYMTIRT